MDLNPGTQKVYKRKEILILIKYDTIEKLIINGDLSSNLADIKDHIIHFFSQLYIENKHCRLDLDGLPFQSINEEEAVLGWSEFSRKGSSRSGARHEWEYGSKSKWFFFRSKKFYKNAKA